MQKYGKNRKQNHIHILFIQPANVNYYKNWHGIFYSTGNNRKMREKKNNTEKPETLILLGKMLNLPIKSVSNNMDDTIAGKHMMLSLS